MNAALARLAEPSTWAGLAAIATGIGSLIASKGADLTAFATIAGGIAAAALQEGRRP